MVILIICFTLALIIASVDWVAVARMDKRLEYFAKPGVMLTLLAAIGFSAGFRGPLLWFGLGVIFSLAGDVFLMLRRERFMAGLVAFLLAHVFYLIGLCISPPQISLAGGIIAVLVGLTGFQLYRSIRSGLLRSNKGNLKLPVMVYATFISLMLLAALLTLVTANEVWLPAAALLVSAGALLFYLSDTLLAWNRFVRPLKRARLQVIVLYHLGQALLILGALLNFYKPG
jgi:alkenylglycerophosphocholine hydrolase